MNNTLILKSILKNFNTEDLLPLRLVSSKFKGVIDNQLQSTIAAAEFTESTKCLTNELYRFQIFKISKVVIAFPKIPNEKYNRQIFDRTVGEILRNRGQVEELILRDFPLDFVLIDSILSPLINLKKFEIVRPGFGTGNYPGIGNSYRTVRDFSVTTTETFDIGIVSLLLQKFPNVKTNFRQVEMDFELLRLVAEGRPGDFEKFHVPSTIDGSNLEKLVKKMENLPVGRLQIKSLKVYNIDTFSDDGLASFTNVLRRLANSLEILEIRCSKNMQEKLDKMELVIPPLRLLRKLKLDLPRINFSLLAGSPRFVYNLGKSLAKDFPELEYLILEKTDSQDYSVSKIGTLWDMWEPFLPLQTTTAEQDGWDLEPCKGLKVADLAIPENWVGVEDQLDWGRKVADTYLKIYSNAGRGTVQKFLEWAQIP